MTYAEWPLGPALRAKRETAGLSIRAAARAAAISEAKWRQLESGVMNAGRGHVVPTGTTPTTVAAAARAVRWDVADALALAGFNPDRYTHLEQAAERADEVPGFGQLSERQRAAVVEMVAAILDTADDEVDGPVPVRTGRAPADLLDRADVKVRVSDPRADDQAKADR